MTLSAAEKEEIEQVTWSLVEEIFNALGLSKTGFACKTFGWTLKPITRKLAVMTIPADHDVRDYGTQVASRKFVQHFVTDVKSRGSEFIPQAGPVLVASNHPGAYDSFAIVSQIPRTDTKMVVSDIPFLRFLPTVRDHVIYSIGGPSSRADAVRKGIKHLQAGGCLAIFSTGLIDPDPEVWGEADADKLIEDWSPSLELFLQKVPEAKLVVTITSGVLDPNWAESRLTHIVRAGVERRRLAEFGQVISQLLRPGRKKYLPHISFAPPLTLEELGHGRGEALRKIKERARELLKEHMAMLAQGW